MSDVATRVRDYYESVADPVTVDEVLRLSVKQPVQPIDPDFVVARHSRPWRKAWVAGLAAVVVLVVVGGVAWLAQLGGRTPSIGEDVTPTTVEVTPTTQATTTTGTVTSTTLAAVPIVPNGEGPKLMFVESESPATGNLGGGVWFNGALYVIEGDRNSLDHRLFRSADGLTWELVPGLPGATDIRHSMLRTDGSRLVNLVMTDSDEAIQVNTSLDGDDWISSGIQLPMLGRSNMAGEFGVRQDARLAVGPRGIVVAATVSLTFEGEGFANGLVDPDEGIHVEVVDLDLDRGLMIVSFHDENNEMEQIGDLREIDLKGDLNGPGFSDAFSNLLDAMAGDPAWAPLVPGFIAQLTDEVTQGFAHVSVASAWFSSDGATWQRVENAGPLDGGEFTALVATPDRFVATASSAYKPNELPESLRYLSSGFDTGIVWESSDGLTWTEATDLTGRHPNDGSESMLASWNGELVELVGLAQRRGDATQVWTLADPQQPVFSDIPTQGMRLTMSQLGLIGTPTYGWEAPGEMEILLSVDGTSWNRWLPSEFGQADAQAEASIVGVGDDFLVLQVTEWDESFETSSHSLWVGSLP